MEREDFSRRSLLQGIVAAIAAGAFPSASSQTMQAAAANGLSFLSPLEAADIDAVTAQIAYLKTVDRTPFFEATRLLTLLGMFTSPEYGGNRDGLGWTLIGFDAQHMFQPPFGYYDRDYPGFTAEPVSSK